MSGAQSSVEAAEWSMDCGLQDVLRLGGVPARRFPRTKLECPLESRDRVLRVLSQGRHFAVLEVPYDAARWVVRTKLECSLE